MFHLSIEVSFSDSTITLHYYRQYCCDSSLELLCASLKCRGNFPHRLHCTLIWVTFVFPSHLLSFCHLFFKRARVLKKYNTCLFSAIQFKSLSLVAVTFSSTCICSFKLVTVPTVDSTLRHHSCHLKKYIYYFGRNVN